MTGKNIFSAMGSIDADIIERAAPVEKRKNTLFLRLGTAAACLCLVVAAVFGIKAISPTTHYTALEDGGRIAFGKVKAVGTFSDIDAEIKPIEISGISAYAYYAPTSGEFMGISGYMGEVKVIIYAEESLVDLEVSGNEKQSILDGVPVNCGYAALDKTEIYYLTMMLDGYTVYLESVNDANLIAAARTLIASPFDFK